MASDKNMVINESEIDRLVHRQMRRQELMVDTRFCTRVIDDKRKKKDKHKKNWENE